MIIVPTVKYNRRSPRGLCFIVESFLCSMQFFLNVRRNAVLQKIFDTPFRPIVSSKIYFNIAFCLLKHFQLPSLSLRLLLSFAIFVPTIKYDRWSPKGLYFTVESDCVYLSYAIFFSPSCKTQLSNNASVLHQSHRKMIRQLRLVRLSRFITASHFPPLFPTGSCAPAAASRMEIELLSAHNPQRHSLDRSADLR